MALRSYRILALVVVCVASTLTTAAAAAFELPEDHRALKKTTSYAEMESFLLGLDGKAGIRVTREATTLQGRSVFLVRLARPSSVPSGKEPYRILFYAQQHGDEVSGKDALLYLLRDAARRPETVPAGVELYVFPMMNPDGAEAGTRRNAAKADLNRDHHVLEQPETQALHRVARAVRPHLAVDGHEFARDGADRRARGWTAWPEITMDGLNNPHFDPAVIAAARRWVDEAGAALAAAGHRFLRYTVGGLPPYQEQRPSAPDIDGGLNGIGMYGGLSFIIEAAVARDVPDSAFDLGNRVDAYLVLLRRFLAEAPRCAEDVAAIEASRRRALPPFLPTNYLWTNPTLAVAEFPVLEAATGRTVRVPTANMMTTLAVKSARPTPAAYAIEPRAAEAFRPVLERHGIPYEVLEAPRAVRAERCTLVRLEDEVDEVYARYEGRQVVRCAEPAAQDLPAGTLLVPLRGEAALRAAAVLEPAALYGLFQYPRFRPFATPGAVLPIARIR